MSEGTSDRSTLTLLDSVGMAIGGMVGGGIFAVLGVAATEAGNGAFISFGIAGLLALLTGVSYARLTTDYDEAGGSFSYVEELAGPHAAGTLSWFLLVGYLFTNALYAYTFGAYAGRLLGADPSWHPFLGSGIVVLLGGINVAGVRASATVEDIIVYGKVALLVGLVAVGFLTVSAEEALPVLEESGTSVVGAAALIFVGYEGFQLLTYDYDDIADHAKNLPRALWISISSVTVLYVLIAFVLTGSVTASTIAAREETVLAEVAQPVLGRIGLILVLVAAVFSTASAINATLFATGRLARRVEADGQLPAVLTRRVVHGVPVVFLFVQVSLAVVLLFTADLEQIVTFSSLVFLLVFSVVNGAAAWHGVFDGWQRVLPTMGGLSCLAAAAILVVRTASDEPETLVVVGGVAGLLLILRFPFRLVRGNG
ncbi:MAG: APC family permease [Longimicrobiales bacterium]|nr:APC family permease [Longimicrobiales bacterium]